MISKRKIILSFGLVLALSLGMFASNFVIGRSEELAVTESDGDVAVAEPISAPAYYPMSGTISVQGEAVVNAVPDIAYVSIGVETSNKEMQVAQKENKDKMNNIISELNKLGIDKNDIQTKSYNVSPEYTWDDNYKKSVVTGYRVVNIVKVKIKEIDKCGKILDAIAKKDANIVYGVEFAISDAEKAYQEALKSAIKNAEDKAKAMVGYFGKTQLTPTNIKELTSNSYVPSPIYRDAVNSIEASVTPINPGEIEIKAQVSVDFIYQ